MFPVKIWWNVQIYVEWVAYKVWVTPMEFQIV